jgi:hypothetical protein
MNSGASLSLQTERLASETGNVQGGVDVPMMFRTAIAAHPLPDPESFQPSRAADASARRTGSGCMRFIDFQIGHPRVIAFVSEVAPQHRPSGIERALCHAGLRQLGSRHIADCDPAGPIDLAPGKLVQGVLSPVRYLGVDRLDLPLTATPLCFRQLRFQVAVEGRLLQFRAVRAGGDGLQPKIDPDFSSTAEGRDLNLTDDVAIPPSASVLGEGARFDPALKG